MTWPKLLGVTAGAIGIGATAFAVSAWRIYGIAQPGYGFSRYGSITGLLGCMLFLFLSYPVYRGFDWARRLLLIVSLVVSVACLLFAANQLIYSARSGGADFLMATGVAMCFVTPPLFLVAVLRHKDVVSAFRRTPTI